ncbi:MAG: TIGR04282 family arsenosugar biosynthesis glycosyltransferase [Gammaproteobacteria bacterium]|nr:TIGR04282 family arsenosugar biosynthesis glycosyltransferase [Gammaproteobacteria bacterium]MDH3857099.1 TIGR04282 family arsenosugar biosynthesis glycosyltransferase [Gammaproteobacteria bacterium]
MIALGIFAKPPTPGFVKTRLIPDIGASKAASVYRYCLEYTLEVARQSGLDYRLYVSEISDDALLQDEEYTLQKGHDLGIRMFNAMQDLLATGTDGAIIIGSDCLDITARHLHQAAQALADHELVLLPTFDGGYALIGCTSINPALFRNVHWSSDRVLKQTVANARSMDYRVRLFDPVRDIDTLQDLEKYPELFALIASS